MKHLISLMGLFLALNIKAQTAHNLMDSFPIPIDYDQPVWADQNKFGVNLNEVSFVNWSAGGSNAVAATLIFEKKIEYKDLYYFWDNKANIRYGLNKQEGHKVRKAEDVLEISSNWGYKSDSLSNWFYSAKLNFKTQITNGYNYPNRKDYISRFMSPGYLFLGAGFEYGKHVQELSLYMSPFTLKSTFVIDDLLANRGAFGVTPAVYDLEGNPIRKGEHVRQEIGAYFTSAIEKEVFDNIRMKNLLSLYSDYANDFCNVDVDWQIVLDFKVNKYVKASVDSHLKYDNDIKLTETDDGGNLSEEGAKVQWKQILGIGFELVF